MEIEKCIKIRLLTLDNIDGWLSHCETLSSESGENNIYFVPYSKYEAYPVDKIRQNTIERWGKSIDTPGWRRAWGLFDNGKIIGSAQISAGDLPTNLHRVDIGVGIYKEYRNFGLGQKLFNTIIDWCKEQPSIFWIDLGVFSGNDKAKTIFENIGFKIIGYKEDAWFIDEISIGETSMTLNVK